MFSFLFKISIVKLNFFSKMNGFKRIIRVEIIVFTLLKLITIKLGFFSFEDFNIARKYFLNSKSKIMLKEKTLIDSKVIYLNSSMF